MEIGLIYTVKHSWVISHINIKQNSNVSEKMYLHAINTSHLVMSDRSGSEMSAAYFIFQNYLQ
jgi:hypothetical protein